MIASASSCILGCDGLLRRAGRVQEIHVIGRRGVEEAVSVSGRHLEKHRDLVEVFHAGGYAQVARDARLATTTGMVPVEEMVRLVREGREVVLEEYRGEVSIEPQGLDAPAGVPHALSLNRKYLDRIRSSVMERCCEPQCEVPRILFGQIHEIMVRRREAGLRSAVAVDNKTFPSVVQISEEKAARASVLAVTTFRGPGVLLDGVPPEAFLIADRILLR